MAKKAKTQNKAVKAVADIKPQASVDTKALAVVETQSTVARTPISLEWIEFKNKLITTNLIETVKEHTEIIQTLLTSRRKLDIQIARELAILRNQFLAYAAQNGLEKTETDDAFGEYVQAVFNIKGSRASEYIRVAGKQALQDLKLPISKLCELARLNDEALIQFLVDYPPEDIENMPFREVQILVQGSNENRVTRTAKSRSGGGSGGGWTKPPKNTTVAASIQPTPSSNTSVQAAGVITGEVEPTTDTAESADVSSEQELLMAMANLRVAFTELKAVIEKSGLDKNTSDLLAEITQYYESAQNKGGV